MQKVTTTQLSNKSTLKTQSALLMCRKFIFKLRFLCVCKLAECYELRTGLVTPFGLHTLFYRNKMGLTQLPQNVCMCERGNTKNKSI